MRVANILEQAEFEVALSKCHPETVAFLAELGPKLRTKLRAYYYTHQMPMAAGHVYKNLAKSARVIPWQLYIGYMEHMDHVQLTFDLWNRLLLFPSGLTIAEVVIGTENFEMAVFQGRPLPTTYMKLAERDEYKKRLPRRPRGRPKGSKNKPKKTHQTSTKPIYKGDS